MRASRAAICGLLSVAALAASVPAGKIVDPVKCVADPAQSYALYLPARYSAERAWPVILTFEPLARGRLPVERFQAAAEAFGYIVAASNNSRNGPWEDSMAAARAMTADVLGRFAIDSRRVYLAGMSGGARVALALALGSSEIAGVVACAAGYPGGKLYKKVPFPIFATAGADDFNYVELRRLDRELTTPHHLAIFTGGHGWLSSDLAVEAIEWLEIEAMRAGRRPRDAALVDRIFAKRTAALAARGDGPELLAALDAMAADFAGFKEVAEFSARAAALRRDKRVKQEIRKELDAEHEEERQRNLLDAIEAQLANPEQAGVARARMREAWKKLAAGARAGEDSQERRVARRVWYGAAVSAQHRKLDPEYRKIIAEFGPSW